MYCSRSRSLSSTGLLSFTYIVMSGGIAASAGADVPSTLAPEVMDLGEGKLLWYEGFDYPDGSDGIHAPGTSPLGNAHNQATGWRGRARVVDFYPENGGFAEVRDGRMYGQYMSDIDAPGLRLRREVLEDVTPVGTTAVTVSLNVGFGDGDWSGGDNFVFNVNTTAKKPEGLFSAGLSPRLRLNPEGQYQLFNVSDGIAETDAGALAASLGKNFNSDDMFQLTMSFDSETLQYALWINDVLVFDETHPGYTPGFSGFDGFNSIDFQFEYLGGFPNPNHVFLGDVWMDDVIVANYVATPSELRAAVPEPTAFALLACGGLMMTLRRRRE